MAQNLRDLRLSRGWTQLELATKCDIPRRDLSRCELGQWGPDREQAGRLAQAFDCLVEDLDLPAVRQSTG